MCCVRGWVRVRVREIDQEKEKLIKCERVEQGGMKDTEDTYMNVDKKREGERERYRKR